MEIRNNLDGLKSLFGVAPATQTATQQPKNGAASSTSSLMNDRATLSSAGSEVSQMAADPEIRMDKVAAIQAALAAGTYKVPASDVASKVLEAMMGGD
jgi:negative regulator of flagellin synthesis FlgM